MENLLENNKPLEDTINARDLIGSRVLSKEGYVFGRIVQVRINPKGMNIEGIIVNRGLFRDKVYIGKSYFEKISSDSILLNIQPNVLMKAKRVVTTDGKVLGRVKKILRVEETNNVKEIIVKRLFSKEFSIPASQIEFFGKSIMLKKSYSEKVIIK